MISPTILYDINKIEGLSDFIAAYPDYYLEMVRDSFNVHIIPPMLSELRHYPDRTGDRFRFETPKSRRYYFFMLRKGLIPTDGKQYKRTGRLAEGYKAEVVHDDGSLIMYVENKAKTAWKWTKGKRQVIGHADTGWVKDALTIDFWQDAAREVALKDARNIVRHGVLRL